ncbi:MAG TPA: dTDP-4-dehydrorhamnose 3,5-epimerase [Anaerolineae bacterium]|nr:dTDP-4-dehydrorhamnose 3,5-epimerase [Anaerolineae bacterium]
MTKIIELPQIKDVFVVELAHFGDERGYFTETFRKEWFPQRSWDIFQCNRSESTAGTLRGLHYHHNQVDYWYAIRGQLRAGLYDLRPNSPTHGQAHTIEMGDNNRIGLFIPIGVAHGFIAYTDITLTYIVDNYYNGQDEFGIAWNDPALGLDWGQTPSNISTRDAQNPLLKDLPPQQLPVPYNTP